MFSLTMYSFSTFFFPLNEFSASQKCWIDRLLERGLLFIPQMRTARAAAGGALTFRQVELSKKNSHSCQYHLKFSLTPVSHEIKHFVVVTHISLSFPCLTEVFPANSRININLPMSLAQGESLQN